MTPFNQILIGKFEHMMHANVALIKSGSRVRQVVTIRVISGQNLPKVPQEESDIVDPYVTLKVYGHPQDQFKYKTKSVSNNGICFLSK
jgi:C2 domain